MHRKKSHTKTSSPGTVSAGTVSPGEAYAQQGAAAWNSGKVADAANAFSRAALLDPQRPDNHVNLGVALRRLSRVDASIASYRRAMALNPDDPVMLSNLGNSLRDAGRLDEAESYLRRACQLAPHSLSFAYNLALVVRDTRRHAEARVMFQDILDKDPNNADVAWDIALTDLYLLDYERGWRGYETRWRLARAQNRQFPGPQWRPGLDVQGKIILITAEQGFGDSLQFARFLPVLVRLGAKLVVECQEELQDLFRAIPGVIGTVVKHAPPPPYDFWVPIMSLAWLLTIRYDSIPAQVPYLAPPPDVAFNLPSTPGIKLNVGLIWAGKMTPRDRSWPLTELLPLMEDPRVAMWSLQLGDRVQDLRETGIGTMVRDLSPQIKTFADSAAIMNSLDLIITVDTSACHLAGALGRPTWILLRYVSDWRWLDEPDTCAWYPTVRLFRQPNPQDFTSPVRQMRAALDDLLATT